MSSMDNFSYIFNSPLVEDKAEQGSHTEVIAKTPPQGDTEYFVPTGAAVENHPQNTEQLSRGGGTAGCAIPTLIDVYDTQKITWGVLVLL